MKNSHNKTNVVQSDCLETFFVVWIVIVRKRQKALLRDPFIVKKKNIAGRLPEKSHDRRLWPSMN